MYSPLFCLFFLPLVCSASQPDQLVMNQPDSFIPPTTPSGPTLADLLTLESSTSIFYSYAREVELSERFGMDCMNTTLLVPTNKAVMALSRKPHQGPASNPLENPIDISEQEHDIVSKRNVERWVSAHIIPQSPISLSGSYDTLLDHKSVTFYTVDGAASDGSDWHHVLLNGDTRILARKEGSNGILYIIDGTVAVD